jgi:hypothetical protein
LNPTDIKPFACAMCGNCCRGKGYVRVTPEEVRRIAAHLGMAVDEFVRTLTRKPEIAAHAKVGDLWLIEENAPDYRCPFLEGSHCTVNPVKPAQCAGFPLKWRTRGMVEECVGMKS